MWRSVGVNFIIAGLAVLTWYIVFRIVNRRHGSDAIEWIETALSFHGEISAVKWLSASRVYVRLRLASSPFRQPTLLIQLMPREMPLEWLLSWWRGTKESVTFQANFDCAPGFNLEVQNLRMFARTRRRLKPNTKTWTFEHVGPFVISTRRDWKRDLMNLMDGLVASRACDFTGVSFRNRSPHFSATVPLNSFSPQAQAENDLFDVLGELASGASASKF